MNWKALLAAFGSILILDFIWLGFIARKFYASRLVGIARTDGDRFEINYVTAGLVYLLLAAGILFFVLPKIQADDSWLWTWMVGALLGLVCYGVYDFTNMSIMNWPLPLAIADIAWGAFVCGVGTLAARAIS